MITKNEQATEFHPTKSTSSTSSCAGDQHSKVDFNQLISISPSDHLRSPLDRRSHNRIRCHDLHSQLEESPGKGVGERSAGAGTPARGSMLVLLSDGEYFSALEIQRLAANMDCRQLEHRCWISTCMLFILTHHARLWISEAEAAVPIFQVTVSTFEYQFVTFCGGGLLGGEASLHFLARL